MVDRAVPFHSVPFARPHPPLAHIADLAGRESVAWKINREVVVLLGWGGAILQQFAHPLVAAGVTEHSQFMADTGRRVQRLRQTLRAMLDLTFGDAAEVARAARGINVIHDRVHGTLREPCAGFAAGTRYSAHDPALLRWVHATLLDTLPRTYELFVGHLTAEELDRYCAEATGLGPLLGVPSGYLPASRGELRRYMDEMWGSGEIVVTDTARRLAREVLTPPLLRRLPPLLSLVRLPAIGLLPPALRVAYGFHWGAPEAAALRTAARLSRRLMPVLVPQIRFWPAARRAYRRRMAPAAA